MEVRYRFAAVLLVFSMSAGPVDGVWADAFTDQSDGSTTEPEESSPPGQPQQASSGCLSDPIQVKLGNAGAEEAARATGKKAIGSLLSSATGGLVGFGGGEKPKLARRPRYPRSKIQEGRLKLELQGAAEDGKLRMAVRIKDDPEKGAPHLIALQDRNCRILMPVKVSAFELWGTWSLQVSWTKSYYENGRLMRAESGGWNTSWTELLGRYHSSAEIPGIWQSFGNKPFKGVRGIIAEFQLPPGETFTPGDWYLVTQVTRPGPTSDAIVTEPVVASLHRQKDNTFHFEAAHDVAWNTGAPRANASGVVALVGAGASAQGLVSAHDCKKISDEINQLQCAANNCEKEKAALAAAEQAYADAQQGRLDAQAAVDKARDDVQRKQRAREKAMADQDKAEKKKAITETQQGRLMHDLSEGGFGLSASQTAHAMEASRQTMEKARANAERAGAAADQAEHELEAANAAFDSARSALASAAADEDQMKQAVDAARDALKECLERDRKRCEQIEQLMQQYDDCRHRYREQEKTRDTIDRAKDDVADGQQQVAEGRDDYYAKAKDLKDRQDALNGLGGTPPASSVDNAGKADVARQRAEQYSRDADARIREAENKYQRGDLDGATQSANEAKDAQDKARQAMEAANDQMDNANDDMDSEYRKVLLAKERDDERRREIAAREAMLKKEVCIRHLAEYYGQQSDDDTLLKTLGGFVSKDAKGAIADAQKLAYSREAKEALDELEKKRQLLESLLGVLNGIADNDSLDARNQAFSSALEISRQISEKIPGMGAFFDFYIGGFNAAVKALNALGERIVSIYKPDVDNYIRKSGKLMCCSYNYRQLDKINLDDLINYAWLEYKRSWPAGYEAGLRGGEGKLEQYFKARLRVHWIHCCLDYALHGPK